MNKAETATPFTLAGSRLNTGNYIAGSCSDGRKLGIALGSGGMAGINQLGKLWSLQEAGVLDVVDHWEGDSIGGIDSGIAVAGQIEEATETFYTLRKKGFIDKWRAARIGGRAVDYDILASSMLPILDTEKIANPDSPVPINIGVTRLKPYSRLSVDLTLVEPEEVIPWMMRGAHLPIAGGAAPRDKDGIPYADGGISSLGPVHRAIVNGCTDVIYLSCQPKGQDEKNALQVLLVGGWAMRHDPAAILKFNRVVTDQIKNRKVFRDGPFTYNGANVVGVYPPQPQTSEDALPTMYDTDPGILRNGFARTSEYTRNLLAALLPKPEPAPVAA